MAGNNYFQFKHFKIIQKKSAMKVGTDGILLGAWVNVANVKSVLDIGTGTGLIALMIVQRSRAKITAIEIDENAANEAVLNILNSPWKKCIEIYNISLQDFTKAANQKFDLIVSNPPFFNNSLKKKSDAENFARHTDSLSYAELITAVSRLLANEGRFALILPEISKTEFVELANNFGLNLIRETLIYPKVGSPANRCLMEFSMLKQNKEASKITIYSKVGIYSPEFKNLTKDFYLNL